MKILWLSHLVPYPPKGGVLQRSHHLVRELAQYHEVDLLAFNQKALMKPLFRSVEAGLQEAAEFLGGVCRRHRFVSIPVDEDPYGKHKLALKSLFGEPYNMGWLRSDEYRDAMRAWLADTTYDLIHFDTISLARNFDQVPAGVATALDHHNIESSMLLRRAGNDRSWLKKSYFYQEGIRLRRVERSFCPRFSVNITCSDLDSQDLRNIAPGSVVETIPNGVDTSYFTPGTEGSELRLAFVGRLNWYPNARAVEFIAGRLWPLLTREWPALTMDIVGANAPAAAVELSRRDSRFKVHGFVDDVRPLMARATAFVCPIDDGGGTKLKVLDAMAMGKVMVANPIACEGIEVTEGVNVLFAREPEEYIEQLRGILLDGERRRQMGIAARKMVEDRYSYTAIGRRLAQLYEREGGESRWGNRKTA
jgi:glycosyltransferase involved in cell wall biosynthesis